MPSTETWWLYVLECQGGVLYTGIAKDVDARFGAPAQVKSEFSEARKGRRAATGAR